MDSKLQIRAYELLIESQDKKIHELYVEQDKRMMKEVDLLQGTCNFIASKLGYKGLMEYAKAIDVIEGNTGDMIEYVECDYAHLEGK